MSRFRRKAGASRLLARYVRASNGRAGWRAVVGVGRPKACARAEGEQSKARSEAGPNLGSCCSRNRSAKTSGRSTSTGRACRRGLGRWAHRQATWRTDCCLISAPTAAMVALRQPGNWRNRPFLLPYPRQPLLHVLSISLERTPNPSNPRGGGGFVFAVVSVVCSSTTGAAYAASR